MKDFNDKTAFVTGAASGIGFAICKSLITRGAKVVMADIDRENLENAAQQLAAPDRVVTIQCDVANQDSVRNAADIAIDRFDKIHLLFNNAGVSLAGASGAIDLQDWRWIVDINLMGVVHGVEIFTPHMREHQEESHIINTASMAGHVTTAYMSPYHATKFAVVGYSESLQQDLANTNIGVSVLCPTWVKSNIYNAHGNSPSNSQSSTDFTDSPVYEMSKQLVDNGMCATTFAELTLKAITDKRLYIFNDETTKSAIDARRDLIMADYDSCLKDASKLT